MCLGRTRAAARQCGALQPLLSHHSPLPYRYRDSPVQLLLRCKKTSDSINVSVVQQVSTILTFRSDEIERLGMGCHSFPGVVVNKVTACPV